MREIKKLQRKILSKQYGVLGLGLLLIVSPKSVNGETIQKWHKTILTVKDLSDSYGKFVLIFFPLFFIIYFLSTGINVKEVKIFLMSNFTLLLEMLKSWFTAKIQ